MSRTTPYTVVCKVCRRILVNDLWVPERREYHVKYRRSICTHCVESPGHRTLPRQSRGLPHAHAGSSAGLRP